jgi:hypothetical protein
MQRGTLTTRGLAGRTVLTPMRSQTTTRRMLAGTCLLRKVGRVLLMWRGLRSCTMLTL